MPAPCSCVSLAPTWMLCFILLPALYPVHGMCLCCIHVMFMQERLRQLEDEDQVDVALMGPTRTASGAAGAGAAAAAGSQGYAAAGSAGGHTILTPEEVQVRTKQQQQQQQREKRAEAANMSGSPDCAAQSQFASVLECVQA